MTELFSPEDRIALLMWCFHKWGMETPVSGDTLAMHDLEKGRRYLGGVIDEHGWHPAAWISPYPKAALS